MSKRDFALDDNGVLVESCEQSHSLCEVAANALAVRVVVTDFDRRFRAATRHTLRAGRAFEFASFC
jgi:hypothetical protein